MNKSYQAPQGRLLSTLVIFVFAVGFMYSSFLLIKHMRLKSNLNTIAEQSVELQNKIEALERDNIRELFYAQELKKDVEDVQVAWSKVIRKFQDLTPLTVFYNSFSGSAGELNVSGLAETPGSVADLLTELDRSEDFVNMFVPSLTEGTTPEGQSVVSFNLRVNADL